MKNTRGSKIISSVAISKKIAEMSSQLVGYWSEDRWDIRKCPNPSAIDLAKNPSLKNRWVNFESVENIWLRTELKYFFYYHLISEIWSAKTFWIRKGTVVNRMLGFLSLKYPNIKSITEVPIEKAMTEYRTYLIQQGIKITTTNYKLNANQEKIAVKANSYYVTNLKQFMEFYEDFYFGGEEWEKDIWDRRKMNLSSDKVNPTQYEYIVSFKGISNHYFRAITKRYCKFKLNTVSFSYAGDIARKLKGFFTFLDANYKHIVRLNQLTREEIEHYLSELNQSGLSPSTLMGKISILEVFLSLSKN